MSKEPENLAWSLYWADDRLQSCVATDNDSDQQALNSIWQDFAKSLGADAKVLDLASGNGAVPVALLSAQPNLEIDAVDKATIEPNKFVSGVAELDQVKFHSDTDINALAFSEQSFDALTSQYGIEYAGLFDVSRSVLNLLKPNGTMSFLIHHSESEIIRSSRAKMIEMEALLHQNGIVECLIKVLRGDVEFAVLESKGEAYLASQDTKTPDISGQVFTAIGEIADAMPTDMVKAVNMGATLKLRLSSEYQRLHQMSDAAQSETEINEYRKVLEQNEIVISNMEPIYADEKNQSYLLAWLIQGKKSAE